ncbi:MAG TPA: 50S ribosomal protein L30 [Candidatus Nanoarchaeia archaeon]|nr:50S ribosomal protein L30 [Candidatus Nanoarchaeia archaeon]
MATQQPETEACKCVVAVKIRGMVSAQREARETTALLGLSHTNHAIIIDNRPAYMGMLKRAQSYVTWGEASKEIVTTMLKQRAKTGGDKKLTEEYAQKLGFKTIDDLAEAIFSCKAEINKLDGVQKTFRLRPPKKGYKGKTKKSFNAGGEAGYRGEAINELVKRMV